MIRRLILLIGLAGILVGLGSCDWSSNRPRYRSNETQAGYDRRVYEERMAREEERRARRAAAARDNRDNRDNGDVYDIYDSPSAWLTLDYACSGALRRAQWLVCEHEQLGLLHRRLALQWEATRRNASPERVNVLIAQQNAFLRERNACETIACVSAAYYRYLDGSATPTRPWVKPAVKYHPPKRHYWQGDWRRHRGERSGGWSHPAVPDRSGHEPRSCINELGFAAASQMASRCDEVTPGLSSQCSVHNSCGGIRAQTDRGCGTRRNKPGFCRSY